MPFLKGLADAIASTARKTKELVVGPRDFEVFSRAAVARHWSHFVIPPNARLAMLYTQGNVGAEHFTLIATARARLGATHVVVVLYACEAQFKTLAAHYRFQPDYFRDLEVLARSNAVDAVFIPRTTIDVFPCGLAYGAILVPAPHAPPLWGDRGDDVTQRIFLADLNTVVKLAVLMMPRFILLDEHDTRRAAAMRACLADLLFDPAGVLFACDADLIPGALPADCGEKPKGAPLEQVTLKTAKLCLDESTETTPLAGTVRVEYTPDHKDALRASSVHTPAKTEEELDNERDEHGLTFDERLTLVCRFEARGRLAMASAADAMRSAYADGVLDVPRLLEAGAAVLRKATGAVRVDVGDDDDGKDVAGADSPGTAEAPDATRDDFGNVLSWTLRILDLPSRRLLSTRVRAHSGGLAVVEARLHGTFAIRQPVTLPAKQ